MTICKVTGMACDCQPPETPCTGEKTLREGFHSWRNAAIKAEARIRELERAAPNEPVAPQAVVECTSNCQNQIQWLESELQRLEAENKALKNSKPVLLGRTIVKFKHGFR
jgi:hypothetical protein